MKKHPPLLSGLHYHIYNRANGRENLFREDANHLHFLQLYDKYISPVAETYAWVLMANHFHLLVRIKEDMYYRYSKEDFEKSASPNTDRSANADAVRFEDVKWETIAANPSAFAGGGGSDGVSGRKKANPTNHFSHLFNAYAKYINEKYDRHGSLFQRPFKRKPVEDENYLRQVILYIHNNPVHHGFTHTPEDYPWSSYHTCLSDRHTKLRRSEVMDYFESKANFKAVHQDYADYRTMEVWLEDEGE